MSPRYAIKRALDYALAAAGLAVCAPAMVVIAAAISVETPGGALFVQERLGRAGRPFRLLKFRTMREAPIRYREDGSTRIDPSDDRITKVGRLLRGSIDELPQLINVLRGEMSVVGPRPDMATQRPLYAPGEERKLEVLPGITSLAVVLGRNEIPWKQRIAIDIRYIDNWSLGLDLRIIAQTVLMAFGAQWFDFTDVLPDDRALAPRASTGLRA